MQMVVQSEKGALKMQKPEKTTGKRVNFFVSAASASRVFIAGTFNNWDPTANPLHENSTRGYFKTVLQLKPGKHEYKFIINGEWVKDPMCLDQTPDPFGSENSVIQV